MSGTATPPTSSSSRAGEKKWLFWAVMLVALAAVVIYNNRPAPPSAVEWVEGFETAKAKAAESNKLLFVDFYATWCGPCKMMEREVYPRKDVAQALGNWVAVKVDVDRQGELAYQFKIVGVPTLMVFSPQGRELARVSEGMDDQMFISWIRQVEKAWKEKAPQGAQSGS